MAQKAYFVSKGINLYTNPLATQDGQLLRAVNVDSYPYGAKVKRLGYGTYVAGSSPQATAPTTLFSWYQNNGTTLYTYLAVGSGLYYSTQGTGAWTICGNGTITVGSAVGYAVLNNTLVMSQNAGTTRHTTNGTSFSDTSGAPAGGYLEQFQNRVYITGTSTTLTYSVTNDATNWQTTGTSDSSSLQIPGAGLPNRLFKLANRLFISKNSRQLFRWDGYYLVDTASNMGLSSPYSYGSVEDNGFWLNRLGVFTSSGAQPQLISNAVQRYIYNDIGSAIAGTSFDAAPAVVHRYDYLCAIGSVTDDLTNETISDDILKYDFQKNEFLNYTFNDFPRALHSYKDTGGTQQLIFSNSVGQCFIFGGTNLSDNGKPIEAIMEYVYTFDAPYLEKDMRWFLGFFNPGCEAHIQIALSNTFTKGKLKWIDIGQAVNGLVQYRFPTGSRGRLCYLKITESSQNSRFSYYGCAFDFTPVSLG